jgi:hypothetical protein
MRLNNVQRTLATGIDEAFGPNACLLDSQAGMNLCKNKEVGWDFKQCKPRNIAGVEAASEGMVATQTCLMLDTKLGRMSYLPGAVANIISEATAHDNGFIVRRDEVHDTYSVQHRMGGRTYKFGRQLQMNGNKSKHYAMDMRTLLPLPDIPFTRIFSLGPDTVAANKSKYTKREVADAEMALRFLGVMGAPTMRVAEMQLSQMRNPPITAGDLKRCADINKISLNRVKGATTKQKSVAADKGVPSLREPEPQVMEIDICFIKRQMFLIGLACPLDFVQVIPLQGGRGADELADGITSMTQACKAHGFPVTEIRCDNEGGVRDSHTVTYLNSQGIPLEFVGAGSHCPRIERRIRWVKEKFRGMEHTLPFAMNSFFVRWGMRAAARFTNLQRTASSTSPTTPRDKFLDRRFDWKLDGQIQFGDCIEVTVADTDNTAAPRTDTCIALMHRDNRTGSFWAFHVSSNSPVVRDHFVRRPMPTQLIDQLNRSAAAQGHSRGPEPIQDALEFAPDGDAADAGGDGADTDAATAPQRPATRSQQPELQGEGIDPLPDTDTGVNDTYTHEESAMHSAGVHSAGVQATGVHSSGVQATEMRSTGVRDTDEHSTGVHSRKVRLEADAQQQQQQQVQSEEQHSTISPTSTPTEDQPYWVGVLKRKTALTNLRRSSTARVMAIRKGVNFSDGDFELALLRQFKRTSKWKDKSYAMTISVKAAIRDYPESGIATIEKELQQMISKEVFHPVHAAGLSHTQLRSIIPCKLFVKEKLDPEGAFEKLKGRLVAGGHRQDKELYEDLSSPTADHSSVMTVAAIAACEGRHVATCDIGGAYLNAPISPTGIQVHMRIDSTLAAILARLDPRYKQYIGMKGDVIVQLDKALYGCVESASLWYAQLSSFLTNELDFIANIHDPCVFNMLDAHGKQITIVLHVDDMFLTCETKDTIAHVLAAIDERYPETTMSFGPKIAFLGMAMDFACKGECEITMNGMVDSILNDCDVDGVARSPAMETLFEVNPEQTPLDSTTKQEWFHSYVAKVLYLAKRVKPECLTTVSYLATRVNKADSDDIGKLNRLLRYLRHSRGRGIRLCPGSRGVRVRAYIDAAYGVHVDGKSHSGSAIMIGDNGLCYVKSGKQSIVVKSSTEAEFVGTSDSMNQAFHVRNFIIAQGHPDSPVEILQDNLSCMALLGKSKPTSLRTRHIQIRYFWISERIDSGEAYVTHMSTVDMGAANILTKPLNGQQFIDERQALTNWDKDVA